MGQSGAEIVSLEGRRAHDHVVGGVLGGGDTGGSRPAGDTGEHAREQSNILVPG
jgi:hypothetical protein